MRLLILYLTRDGQTRKIAEQLAQDSGAETTLLSLRDHPNLTEADLDLFDTIVIGASIRYGHFDPLLEQFIARNHAVLNRKKSAFFSVNLTARKANRNTPQTNTYTRKLLAKIAWQPDVAEVFAGALFYPRYGWFDRTMIRFIMKITGGETDTRKEVEYTDWQKVRQFAHQITHL